MSTIDVVKVNASTSYNDLLNITCSSSCDTISSSKTNHVREQELMNEIANLNLCVAWLTKGEYKHKKILMKNAIYYNKRGLGCFLNPMDNITKSPEIKKCFIKKVNSNC